MPRRSTRSSRRKFTHAPGLRRSLACDGSCKRLGFEVLEDRRLLSNWSLQQVLDAYDGNNGNAGMNVLDQIGATAIVNQALNGVSIPFVGQTLASIPQLNLSSAVGASLVNVQSLLGSGVTDATATWSQVQTALTGAGFTVVVPYSGTPDSNGNLLEASYTAPAGTIPSVPISIAQNTPFSYLNNGFFANFSASAQFSVPFTVTFGVDVPNGQQNPTFFVLANPDAFTAALTATIAANTINASLNIGDLASVTATNNNAEQVLNIAGSLGFQCLPSETDGKLRASDFNSLGQVIQGTVTGSAQLSLNFAVQLASLPAIGWSGTFSQDFLNGVLQAPSVNLQEPSASDLLDSLGSSLFSRGDEVPILGPLSKTLNQPLPLIGESIAELTGLDSELPTPPSLPSDFDSMGGSYPLAGGTLTVNVTPTTINQFLNGQNVNLFSWQASRDVTLVDENQTDPIYSLGVPDIASAEIDATFGIEAKLHYDIGFGLDSDGFWLRAGTPSDPTLGLSFEATAGLQGQVEVLGCPLAEAGGDIGFSVTPYVTLTAPPWAADPSKVYLSDLALFGSNPASDLLDDLMRRHSRRLHRRRLCLGQPVPLPSQLGLGGEHPRVQLQAKSLLAGQSRWRRRTGIQAVVAECPAKRHRPDLHRHQRQREQYRPLLRQRQQWHGHYQLAAGSKCARFPVPHFGKVLRRYELRLQRRQRQRHAYGGTGL